jgi:glycosyltransferase involved in cell wall biosynthesis
MRITIVTPTLNRAPFLPEAIESVQSQGYPDVEHIIVDGMSTDETPAVLARHPHLRVIREPDSGLYDALNKGIRAATGEVIGHLNSDDRYAPGAFTAVANAFSAPQVELVSGGAEIVDSTGAVRHRFVHPTETALTFASISCGVPIPNARFLRRSLYERAGFYDLRYRVAADRDLLLRVLLQQPREAVLEQILYIYQQHEGSLTFNASPDAEARWREEYLALAEEILARADLPPAAHDGARRWHLRESAQAATEALWRADAAAFRRSARRGLRRSFWWPAVFLRHVAGKLAGR